MDGLAAVAVRAPVFLEARTRVRPDPHVGGDDLRVESALDRNRRLDRRPRGDEDGKKSVAGLLRDLAAELDDLPANDVVVPGQELLPLVVSERLQKLRRPDDVGEEERPRRLLPAEELPRSLRVAPGAYPLERRQSGLELLLGGVLVALPAECKREQQPRFGCLVRRAEVLPAVTCLSQAACRARGVPLREPDPAVGEVDGGLEGGGATAADRVRVDQVFELCRGRAGAKASANLADLVEPARGDLTLEVLELPARRHGDLLRCLEIAAETHDLGAMDAAGAREPSDVELIAPAVRDIGPLGRPAVVAEVVAGAGRHAVDDRRGVRLELAAHGRGGRLVEQLQPRVNLPALHERAALSHEGKHLRVAVSEAPAELEGSVEVGDRGREVALGEERADG